MCAFLIILSHFFFVDVYTYHANNEILQLFIFLNIIYMRCKKFEIKFIVQINHQCLKLEIIKNYT